MAIELDTVNSALIKLGATPIDDLDQDTKEARLAKLQYPRIRDAVLRSAPWGFAVRRIVLTAIDPSPLAFNDGDEFVFQQPVDCVKVWKLLGQEWIKYRIEGRYIIANDSTLNLFYITKAAPVDSMDAAFTECVANVLAADLCYSLTQSTSLKGGLEATAQFWIDQARSHNSQEGTPENFQWDSFLGARTGGRAFYD